MPKRSTVPVDPPDYVLHVDSKDRRWHIELGWGEIGGRFELIGFSLKANPDTKGRHQVPLTAEIVRTMPLGTIFSEAKRRHAQSILRMSEKYDDVSTEDATSAAARWGPQRGRALTGADLERVADAYIRARDITFMPVTQAVADACNVSISTAGKRIMAARRAGLIPERTTR